MANACPKRNSKQLNSLKNNWNVRNNSSGVAAALAPDFSEDSGTTLLSEEEEGKKFVLVSDRRRKQPSSPHCEACYCRQPPTRPNLNLKQPSSEENQNWRRAKTISIDDQTEIKKVHDFGDYCPESYFLRKLRHKWRCGDCEPREKIENFEEEYLRELREYEGNCRRAESPPGEKVAEIGAFRDENYFDCHSWTTAETKPPEHECVFKFAINERLLPEPLNADQFGTNRCEMCNKRQNSDRPTPTVPMVGQKFDKSCAPPMKINVTSRNEQIELNVPVKIINKKSSVLGVELPLRVKKAVPTDTLALRYQKGVV